MNREAVSSAVSHYKQDACDSDCARLDFFERLFSIQDARAADIGACFAEDLPPQQVLDEAYLATRPLLSCVSVEIDPDIFAENCKLMADHLSTEAGLACEVSAALAAYDWSVFCHACDLKTAGSAPREFIEACLSDLDSFAVPSDLPATVFAMVLSFALRPHLQLPAEVLMDAVSATAKRTIATKSVVCPVCAAPAALSMVKPASGIDGREREQYCPTCGCIWAYERIRCGVCGTQNQAHLHYFHIEGDEVHRLQNCEECGQYQRVVFQEGLSYPLCAEVEDVVMAKLDKIALDPRFRERGRSSRIQ